MDIPPLCTCGCVSSSARILPLEFLEHIWRPDPFISNAKDMAVPSALGSRLLIYERDTVLSYSIK